MIGLHEEYEAMFRVESRLWWYRILHGKVMRQIQRQFGDSRELRILDAGCGTGGMLSFLQHNGYRNLRGLDLSEDAVAFTRSRGLNVGQLDLRDVGTLPPEPFDVIICNDVLCYFSDDEIRHILTEFRNRLKPGGLLITNNNALKAFEGVHSIVLKIPRRFTLDEFKGFGKAVNMSLRYGTYWSFLLAPLIWSYRKAQLLALRLNILQLQNLHSDVGYPGDGVNGLLYGLVRAEEQVFSKAPFGSSVFVVYQRPA
ncbi:class I SAM-dependent methyltransferase [Nibrella saemangeumensis]|uniref:Class I SAM-dependent methyltransferase n=1 Tax=Nibrella saemangeumensis TaxID=1084526 RepID=A0ABP8MGZ7_9BACT